VENSLDAAEKTYLKNFSACLAHVSLSSGHKVFVSYIIIFLFFIELKSDNYDY